MNETKCVYWSVQTECSKTFSPPSASILGHSMWDLWWKKWHLGRFSESIIVFPRQYHSTSTIVFPRQYHSTSTIVFPRQYHSTSTIVFPRQYHSTSTILFPRQLSFHQYYCIPKSVSFHQYSKLIYFYTLFLSEPQIGVALLLSTKQCHFGNQRASDKTVPSLNHEGYNFGSS